MATKTINDYTAAVSIDTSSDYFLIEQSGAYKKINLATMFTVSGSLVGTTSTQSLTNKTITDPSNTVTATGLRTATTTVSISAATAPSSGQVLTATSSTTATWQTASGTGDFSTNTSSSVDSEIVLFSGTGGKTGKRSSGSGIAKLTSGVLSVVTAPSGTIVGTTDTQTVSAKRITPRIGTVTDAATITPTGDDSDMYTVTALAQAATIAAPSGTPVNGQKLVLRLLDNGTGRALTWNAIYRVIGVTLPTTTVATKTHYIGMIYNSASTTWDVVAVQAQA